MVAYFGELPEGGGAPAGRNGGWKAGAGLWVGMSPMNEVQTGPDKAKEISDRLSS